MLDIIIPHYVEPWNVGRKFFDMLALQRDVEFDKVHVILVNDGPENLLPEEYFVNRPYEVNQISIEHAGVSAARNAGLKAATHEWVMFCDFDDMFSNVYALRDYMMQLPAPNYDMLWSEYFIENANDLSVKIVMNTEFDPVRVHGKLYRRTFLIENGFLFDTELAFNEDSEFTAIVYESADQRRVGKLITKTPPYVWCWYDGSVTRCNFDSKWEEVEVCHYKRNKRVFDLVKRIKPERYATAAARMVWDMYYALNISEVPECLMEVRNDFAKWYAENKEYYHNADRRDIPRVRRIARMERKKAHFRDDVTIEQWLEEIERSLI